VAPGDLVAARLRQAVPHLGCRRACKSVQNRLQGNYAADVRDYDAVHHHILDMLSAGIIRQFPQPLPLSGSTSPQLPSAMKPPTIAP
jgi:hypothetical protein